MRRHKVRRFHMRRMVVLGLSVAITALNVPAQGVAAAPSLRPSAMQVDSEWSVTTWASGFARSDVGPTGMVWLANETVLVGDFAGPMYRLPASGGSATGLELPDSPADIIGLAMSRSGRVYGAWQLQREIVELNPSNGSVIRTVATGPVLGLAFDPLSGDLFFASGNSIRRVRNLEGPGAPIVSEYAPLDFDGLTFANDGTLYGTHGGPVYRVGGTNTPQPAAISVVGNVPYGDGIAVVAAPLGQSHSEILINRTDGFITLLNVVTGETRNIVSQGSRGDLAAVGPDGCMYATQVDSILKIARANGVCPFETSTMTANAGADQTVPEGSLVGLSGAAVPSEGVGFRWDTLRTQGPRVLLSSSGEPAPSYTAFDDGTYTFRLTTSLGAATSSDDVVVRVTNAPPTVTRAELAPTATDGLAELAVTVSDPGILDTQTLSVNWGDGSPIETFSAAVNGTGWAYGFAGHRYASLGTMTVSVFATDNNGGVSPVVSRTVNVGGAGDGETLPGAGVFAASQSTKNAFNISGSGNSVAGLVHSNNDVVLRGSTNQLLGGAEYRTQFSAVGSAHVVNPAAIQTPAAPFPSALQVADYAPGGRGALAAGASYFAIPSSSCRGKTYSPPKPLTTGLYYVPCGVSISGANIAGSVTIVATGEISFSGSSASLTPFIDGLLFLSGSGGKRAIRTSGSGNQFGGSFLAPTGSVDISGSSNTFDCGMAAQTIDISGSSNRIVGVNCGGSSGAGTTIAISAPPVLVPNLVNTITADKTDVVPGEPITYSATVANGVTTSDPNVSGGGATIFMPMELGVDNRSNEMVTVANVSYQFEVHDIATGQWQVWASTDPAAPATQRNVALLARPNPATGVTYPSGNNAIDGTIVSPAQLASWAAAAAINLTPIQVATLMDPTKVDAVRNTATINSSGTTIRRLTRFAPDPLGALRVAPGGDVLDIQSMFTKFGGAQQFTQTEVPALGRLAPGQTAGLTTQVTASVPAEKTATELDRAYLDRLRSLDTQALVGSVWSRGTSGVGTILAPQQSVLTRLHLPVVEASISSPPVVFAGVAVPWTIRLKNVGSAPAATVGVVVRLADGTPVPVANVPASLEPGQEVMLNATSPTSPGASTSMLATLAATWTQTNVAGTYGPVGGTAQAVVKPAVALAVEKTASLDPAFVPEGQIAYSILLNNTGALPLSNVRLDDTFDGATRLLAGSVSTSAGTILAGSLESDRVVSVLFPTIAPSTAVIVRFRVSFDGAPVGTTTVKNQAKASSAALGTILSDDPNVVGAEQPTVTWIAPPGTGGSGGSGSSSTETLQGNEWSGIGPEDGAVITEPTGIFATLAPRGDTSSWAITVRPGNTEAGSPEERVIASGNGNPPGATAAARTSGAAQMAVGDSRLATIDPTLLANGAYILRFIDVLRSGTTTNIGYTESSFLVEGQYKPGRYRASFADMDVAMGGIPIRVIRSYDSLDRLTDRGLGNGWSLDLANFRVSTTGPLGLQGWTINSCGGSAFIVKYCFTSTKKHSVVVTWPDGRTESFTYSPYGWSLWPSVVSQYTPGPRTTSTLEPAEGDEAGYRKPFDGNLYNGWVGEGTVYDPQEFVLTAKDGTKYLINKKVGLKKITDRSGNTVTISDTGIRSSLGPQVKYVRDENGHITDITGPDGKSVQYVVDANGDLVSVSNQSGATTALTYAAGHYLLNTDDPAPGLLQRAVYGTDGRLDTLTDANGNVTNIDTDIAGRMEMETSPDGLLTTIKTFDLRGNVVQEDQVYDGAHHVTVRTFDSNDQVTSVTDPNGNVRRATYDEKQNVTSFTDQVTSVTRFEYDQYGMPTKITDPLARATVMAYHPSTGLLESVTDAASGATRYGHDAAGNVTSVTDPLGRVTKYGYSLSGMVEVMTDPRGNVTRYEYDGMGRMTLRRDPVGGERTWRYDALGDLIAATNELGDSVTYVRDQAGRISYRRDESGARTNYGYDPVGNVVTVQDGRLNTATYQYSSRNLLIAETLPMSLTESSRPPTRYAYDGAGALKSITDPLGNVTTASRDSGGRVVSITAPNRGTQTISYDGNSRVLSETDGLGAVTRYGYDAAGQQVSMTDPLSRVTSWGYDAAGRVVSERDPVGAQYVLTRDLAGQVTSVRDPLSRTTQYAYDASGNVVKKIDPLGNTTIQTFDSRNLPTSVTDPLGNVSTRTYSSRGQVLSEVDASGIGVQYGYDPVGRLISTKDALGNAWTNRYDTTGNLLQSSDPSSASITHTYDSAGRRIRTQDAAGGAVSFAWNAASQMVGVTDAMGGQRSYSYNGAGDLVGMTDALGRSKQYTYDAAGQLIGARNAREQNATFAYNSAGELLTETRPEGIVARSYDGAGRQVRMSDPSGVTTYGYDLAGQLLAVGSAAGTVGYSYDAAGRNSSIVSGGRTVGYGYDAAGRMTSMVDGADGTFTFGYEPNGSPKSVVRPNGVSTAYSYDQVGRVGSVTHAGASGVLASYVYGYDSVGNRVSNQVTEGGVTRSEQYWFDALSRLKRADYDAGVSEYFSYDAGGSRTSETRGGVTTSYVVDAAQQVVSSNTNGVSKSFTYDADGNLTGAGSDVFRYDSQSRLVGAATAVGVSSQVFDGDGFRVARDGLGVVWDRVRARPVSVGSTALGFGPSGVVSERSGVATRYGLSDVLGSVRSVSDGSGLVVGSTSFGVWGDTRSSSGVGSLVGFQGGLSDTASSVGFGARSFLPEFGRWAQPDPLQPNAPGTQGWLLYGFVGNNPSTFTDPSGLSEFVEYAHVQVLRASAWFGLSGSFGACVTRGLVEAGVVGVGAGVGIGPVDVAATGLSCGLAAGNGKRNVPDVPDDPAPTTRTSPATKSIPTPYGAADQGLDAASIAARSQVENGATVYRIGTTGRSAGPEGQFWSLEHPSTPGYASRYGLPAENVANADFIESAIVTPGSPFITRAAPGIGDNVGGGIEVVVNPAGVTMCGFSYLGPKGC